LRWLKLLNAAGAVGRSFFGVSFFGRRPRRLRCDDGGCVAENVAERVLGHALPGVPGVYNRYDYADEKADALQRLAAKIETIVNPPSGNNVVTFAR
jgi:hypothetical protein